MLSREQLSILGERIYQEDQVNAVAIAIEFKDGSEISISKPRKQINVYERQGE
jgi:hypothetical protein